MERENIVKDKSFKFAVRIYKLSKFLIEKKEFSLSDQILRSGTSIAANIVEADSGQSDKDFLAKLNISFKEAKEAEFWLKLIFEVNLIEESLYNSLSFDLSEIIKILVKSRQTMFKKKSLKN